MLLPSAPLTAQKYSPIIMDTDILENPEGLTSQIRILVDELLKKNPDYNGFRTQEVFQQMCSKYDNLDDLRDLCTLLAKGSPGKFQNIILNNVTPENKGFFLSILEEVGEDDPDNIILGYHSGFNFSSVIGKDKKNYEKAVYNENQIENGTQKLEESRIQLETKSKQILYLISLIDNNDWKNTILKTSFSELTATYKRSYHSGEIQLLYSDTFSTLQNNFPDFDQLFANMHLNFINLKTRLSFIEHEMYNHFDYIRDTDYHLYFLLQQNLKNNDIFAFIQKHYDINNLAEILSGESSIISAHNLEKSKVEIGLDALVTYNLVPDTLTDFNSDFTLAFLNADSMNTVNLTYFTGIYPDITIDDISDSYIQKFIFKQEFEVAETIDFLRNNYDITSLQELDHIAKIISPHTIKNIKWYKEEYLPNNETTLHKADILSLGDNFKSLVARDDFITLCKESQTLFPGESISNLDNYWLVSLLENTEKNNFHFFYTQHKKTKLSFYFQPLIRDIIGKDNLETLEMLSKLDGFWELDFNENEGYSGKYKHLMPILSATASTNNLEILHKLLSSHPDFDIQLLINSNGYSRLFQDGNKEKFNYFFDELGYNDILYYTVDMINVISHFDIELIKSYITIDSIILGDYNIGNKYYNKLQFVEDHVTPENQENIQQILSQEPNLGTIEMKAKNYLGLEKLITKTFDIFNVPVNPRTKVFQSLLAKMTKETNKSLLEIMQNDILDTFPIIIEGKNTYPDHMRQENALKIIAEQRKNITSDGNKKIQDLRLPDDRLELALYPRYHGMNMNHPDIVEYIILFLERYIRKGYSRYFSSIRIIPRELNTFPSKGVLKSDLITNYNVSGDDFKTALHTFSVPFYFSHSSNESSLYKSYFNPSSKLMPSILSEGMIEESNTNDIISQLELEDRNSQSSFTVDNNLEAILTEVCKNISDAEKQLDIIFSKQRKK